MSDLSSTTKTISVFENLSITLNLNVNAIIDRNVRDGFSKGDRRGIAVEVYGWFGEPDSGQFFGEVFFDGKNYALDNDLKTWVADALIGSFDSSALIRFESENSAFVETKLLYKLSSAVMPQISETICQFAAKVINDHLAPF